MSAKKPLNVVLCWHMHQPEYRDLVSGEYQLPWTYLHAMKDYSDMAAHLEDVPEARAVVNFAPVLLDQINDYANQLHGYLKDAAALRDPLLAALDEPALPVRREQRLDLIMTCLRANKERLIDPYPAYKRLADIAEWLDDKPEAIMYMGEQYLSDLLVWYHLAWLGETLKRRDARVKRLMEKEIAFSLHDRRELLEIIADTVGGIIARYRALAERGQVELSVNPYAHPIVPLMSDLGSAREAMPDVPLPLLSHYPGGEERARTQIEQGLATFQAYFGFKPAGCWPSEGSVSTAALKLFAEAGFRWAASGGAVLQHSMKASGTVHGLSREQQLYRPYRMADTGDIACFFRDDGLSDMVGFTYSTWHGDDAVNNLVTHLETIDNACSDGGDYLVPIILDGENAWEFYPNNGYYFLNALYTRLATHPRIRLTTFSDYLHEGGQVSTLPRLVAGSWVYGTFSTWIGDKDKNRAWDILGDAKMAFDKAITSGQLIGDHREAAERQLAICEGSDWFWWFGDYNPSGTVLDFERLYRLHLANLYHMMGEEPPGYLTQTISHGGGSPQHGGTMRPGQEE
jgi:alpha-amylase/alpha-mannosidase (GH57 family)